jgi:hypothetical protein
MKKISHGRQPVALLAAILTSFGGYNAAFAVNIAQTQPLPAATPTPAPTPVISPKPAATPKPEATPTPTAEPTPAQEPAQAQPFDAKVGECRAAKQRIFVYSQRSATSGIIRTLAANEQVTLADTGNGGWVAISAPVKGFVQAKDLKLCSGTPTPPKPTKSLCRIVIYKEPEGLAIRSQPAKGGTRVGGVKLGDRVTLKSDPPAYKEDNDGRAWVEITAPVAGWVSFGYLKGGQNLGPCP